MRVPIAIQGVEIEAVTGTCDRMVCMHGRRKKGGQVGSAHSKIVWYPPTPKILLIKNLSRKKIKKVRVNVLHELLFKAKIQIQSFPENI